MSRTVETVIRLKGESEYQKGLKNCSNEMKVMKSELSLAGSQFRTNANSMEALTVKGNVLSKMYTNQEQKVALLRGALEKAQQTQQQEQTALTELQEQYRQAQKRMEEFGDAVGESSEEYKKAAAEAESLQNAIAKHQTKLDHATSSISKYSIQLNRASVELNDLADQQEENNRLLEEAKQSSEGCAKSIDKYGDAVKETAENTEKATSAVDALAGQMMASGIKEKVDELAGAMLDASHAAQEYELAIAQVSTIADKNVLSKSAASSGILSLSTDLRKDANEVAEAAYEALSAGVDTANVLSFTAQASQLATAGFTDTATSVDVLTTILNAYKMEAGQTEKVASTLVKTQDLGKITVDQLAKQIGRVIPSAVAYGVSLDNVATSYAHMTASGINAENTTTYLTTMLDELADNSKKVSAVLQQETGQSFSQLMSSGKSLGDVLDILGQSVDGDTTKFSNLWSSSTAGKAALSLLSTGAKEFNKTLNEMANSSGTVATNYKKMTDVSDYASQRLTVANKNLSIVVGNQLNPALDKLRNAGAAVIEVATEIIADNPVLVSIISGLVTSLGLLAGGLSALMIVKSVTAAMSALNITMMANPAVLITTAVVGLTAALGVFVAQAVESSSKVDELTEAAHRLDEQIANGSQVYNEAVKEIETTYMACDGYISRLEELEKQGSLTSAEQLEYNALVGRLSELMPGLNLVINEETGLLEDGTKALREKAEGWRDAAMAEALYTKCKDDLAAMADAEYELAKNRANQSIATRDLETYEKELRKSRIAHTHAYNAYQQAVDGANMSEESAQIIRSRSQALMREYAMEIEQLEAAIENTQSDLADYSAAIAESETALANAKDTVAASEEAIKSLSEEYPVFAEIVSDSSASMAGSVIENFGLTEKEYEDLYKSAESSLSGQVGLFEKLEVKCDLSAKEMIKGLQSQKEAFNNYADNLTLAMERGIDIGLVQKLSDGSVESMGILAELVTLTDEKIEDINSAFSGMSVAKDSATSAMVQVNAAVKTGMAEVQNTAYASGIKVGRDSGSGIIQGFKDMTPLLKGTVTSGVFAMESAYKRAADQHSPSRLYQKLARNDVAGLIVQYRADTPKLKQAAASMADAGYVAAIKARRAAIPSLSVSMPASGAAGSDQNTQLLRQILVETKKRQYIKLDTGIFVGATVGAYDEALGQNQILTDRGAQ